MANNRNASLKGIIENKHSRRSSPIKFAGRSFGFGSGFSGDALEGGWQGTASSNRRMAMHGGYGAPLTTSPYNEPIGTSLVSGIYGMN